MPDDWEASGIGGQGRLGRGRRVAGHCRVYVLCPYVQKQALILEKEIQVERKYYSGKKDKV